MWVNSSNLISQVFSFFVFFSPESRLEHRTSLGQKEEKKTFSLALLYSLNFLSQVVHENFSFFVFFHHPRLCLFYENLGQRRGRKSFSIIFPLSLLGVDTNHNFSYDLINLLRILKNLFSCFEAVRDKLKKFEFCIIHNDFRA